MVEFSGILGLLILILDIWAIIQVLSSTLEPLVKLLWVVVILVLPIIGLILWFILGRKSPTL